MNYYGDEVFNNRALNVKGNQMDYETYKLYVPATHGICEMAVAGKYGKVGKHYLFPGKFTRAFRKLFGIKGIVVFQQTHEECPATLFLAIDWE